MATNMRALPLHRAFVVEDDSLERLRLVALLRKFGFSVVEFEDGAQALAAISQYKPDVIVADWQLPVLSGVDLCKSIRTIDASLRPFTILVTAQDQISDLVEAFEAGADDYLTKPYRAEELHARIRAGQRLSQLRRDLAANAAMLQRALVHQQLAYRALDSELSAAASLQQLLLTQTTAPMPGFRSAHLFRPTGRVGSDLFGILPRPNDRAVFFHFDVAGQGISAALHCFSLASELQSLGLDPATANDPSAWATKIQSRLPLLVPGFGCSLVLGWIDRKLCKGQLCQAGAPLVLAVSPSGKVRPLARGGQPRGTVSAPNYEAVEFTLAPGERIVTYSHGIPDCIDPSGVPFGVARLETTLAEAAAMALPQMTQAVGKAVDDWRQEAMHGDDVSLLAIEIAEFGITP